MDVYKNLVVIQASLGGIDRITPSPHYHIFTDKNFPPRKSLTPRLQAKIPKLFGWQLIPNYQYYLWLDGNITISDDNIKYLKQQLEHYDIVVFRHPRRPNIRQEVRYTRKGVNQQSIYMLARYQGEYLKELYDLIQKDKEYIDDLLLLGGIFMYRNTSEVQEMMKQWWYFITRYIVQDQISFPYVIKKSGIRVNILDDSSLFTIGRHKLNVI